MTRMEGITRKSLANWKSISACFRLVYLFSLFSRILTVYVLYINIYNSQCNKKVIIRRRCAYGHIGICWIKGNNQALNVWISKIYIMSAYSCTVYHFYEVWWLLSYKQWSSLCKPLEMLFLTISRAIPLPYANSFEIWNYITLFKLDLYIPYKK